MQNLETIGKKPNPNYIHINSLLSDLMNFEKSLSAEKQKLAEWEDDKEFSILGVIELFTTEIRGYAFEIIEDNFTVSNEQIFKHLQELNFFNLSYFQEWYFESKLDFSQFKKYVESLNYLRLLILEYVRENSE